MHSKAESDRVRKICMRFFFFVCVCGFFFFFLGGGGFSDVLTYCIMLQAFICYCSSSDVYDVRACARVCVFFIGIVQRN